MAEGERYSGLERERGVRQRQRWREGGYIWKTGVSLTLDSEDKVGLVKLSTWENHGQIRFVRVLRELNVADHSPLGKFYKEDTFLTAFIYLRPKKNIFY